MADHSTPLFRRARTTRPTHPSSMLSLLTHQPPTIRPIGIAFPWQYSKQQITRVHKQPKVQRNSMMGLDSSLRNSKAPSTATASATMVSSTTSRTSLRALQPRTV